MIRQSERKSKEISQLPEAALKLVVYPELGLALAEFLQEMLGQKKVHYCITTIWNAKFVEMAKKNCFIIGYADRFY